jgi:hypothetical protein
MSEKQSFLFTFDYDKDAPRITDAFGFNPTQTAKLLADVIQEINVESVEGRNPVDVPDVLMRMITEHRLPSGFLVAAGVMQIKEWQKEARMGVIDLERGMRG